MWSLTRHMRSVTLSLALLAGACACDDSAKRSAHAVNQAVRQISNGNGPVAQRYLKSALKITPDDHDANYYMGALLLRNKDAKAALKYLQSAVASDPTHADAWLHLSRAHFALGQNEQAARSVANLLKADPQHPNGHYLLAILAKARRDRPAQDKALRAAIEGDPGFIPAYLALSRLYTEVGGYEQAMAVLNEGLRFKPNETSLIEALGLAWLDMGEPRLARDVLKIAVKSPAADYSTHLNYAAALLQLGQREPAKEQLRAFLMLGRERAPKSTLRTASRILRRLMAGG